MAQAFSGKSKQPPYRLIDAGRSPVVPPATLTAVPAPAQTVSQLPAPEKWVPEGLPPATAAPVQILTHPLPANNARGQCLYS